MIGMSVEDQTQAVDRHVVVEPAQRDQILRFGGTALATRNDVVDLKPVAAPIDHTSIAVTMDHGPAQSGRDRSARFAVSQRLTLFTVDDHAVNGVAEDCIERLSPHGGSGL
jgi:hypothetical protein